MIFVWVLFLMGVTVQILERGNSNFENVLNERRFDLKCSENNLE